MTLLSIIFLIIIVLPLGGVAVVVISGRPAKQRILYTLILLAAVGSYAGVIYLIRTNPALVAFRQQHGGGWLAALSIGLFFVLFMVGGALRGGLTWEAAKPRERAGKILLRISLILVPAIFALVPIILALEIE